MLIPKKLKRFTKKIEKMKKVPIVTEKLRNLDHEIENVRRDVDRVSAKMNSFEVEFEIESSS